MSEPFRPERSLRENDIELVSQLLAQLEAAHEAYEHQQEETTSESMGFSPMWLRQNGYTQLLSDAKKVGGIQQVFDIAKDATYQDSTDKGRSFTERQAVHILSAAYQEWLKEPEEGRTPFSADWVKRHGYFTFYLWAKTHGGMAVCIANMPPLIQEAFKSAEELYSLKEARRDTKALFQRWQELPPENQGEFNATFILQNAPKVYEWITTHVTMQRFFDEFPNQHVREEFEKYSRRSFRSVLEELDIAKAHDDSGVSLEEKRQREALTNAVTEHSLPVMKEVAESNVDMLKQLSKAHAEWRVASQGKKGKLFTPRWLLRHGYVDLVELATEYVGGFKAFIQKAPAEIRKDFRLYESRNIELEDAMKELRAAHAQWTNEDPKTRRTFDYVWLTRIAGYRSLHNWAESHAGGFDELIAQSSSEVQKDYSKRKKTERTSESGIQELGALHQRWLSEDPSTRGSFTSSWVRKNAGHGLYLWARRHGGFDAVVERSSDAVKRDYVKQKPGKKSEGTQ